MGPGPQPPPLYPPPRLLAASRPSAPPNPPPLSVCAWAEAPPSVPPKTKLCNSLLWAGGRPGAARALAPLVEENKVAEQLDPFLGPAPRFRGSCRKWTNPSPLSQHLPFPPSTSPERKTRKKGRQLPYRALPPRLCPLGWRDWTWGCSRCSPSVF